MPLSPFIIVIGVVFILSVALLLVLALEERFDEKTASEFEHDVAYHTMLLELRQMQIPSSQQLRHRPRWADMTPLYEGNRQGT